MATYKAIQEAVKHKHQKSIKTCWIAHVKELNGFSLRNAPNRISPGQREYPCPDWARSMIEDAKRKLGDL